MLSALKSFFPHLFIVSLETASPLKCPLFTGPLSRSSVNSLLICLPCNSQPLGCKFSLAFSVQLLCGLLPFVVDHDYYYYELSTLVRCYLLIYIPSYHCVAIGVCSCDCFFQELNATNSVFTGSFSSGASLLTLHGSRLLMDNCTVQHCTVVDTPLVNLQCFFVAFLTELHSE